MPAFAYRAVQADGRRVRGTIDAIDPAALARALQSQGLLVLDVEQPTPQAVVRASYSFNRRRSVLEVTRALASLLPAGMPLGRALAAASHVARGETAAALDAVHARVSRGESLAAALAAHPRLFPPIYVGMVRAGERSGDLAGAFRDLTAQLEREDQLRERLLSASIYPLLLAAIGGAAVLVLMLFVLPRFVELLQGAGAALPRSTAMLLAASSTLARWWPALIIAAIVMCAGAAAFAATDAGRRALSALLLHAPLIGRLRRNALSARVARLVAVLLGGGAPLLTALHDASASITDPLARDEVLRIRSRVREGAALHAAVAELGFFPPLLPQLIAVGEESGRLRDFLSKAAEIFESRTTQAVQRLVTLAEPAMIVAFGGIVAFVALSLLQAIYGVSAGAF